MQNMFVKMMIVNLVIISALHRFSYVVNVESLIIGLVNWEKTLTNIQDWCARDVDGVLR